MQDQGSETKNIRIVKLLMRNKFENVLVLKRSETHPTYAHYPDFPGGVVLDGEDDTSALERKLDEETGLMLTADKAVKVSEHTLPIYKDQTITQVLYSLKTDFDQPRIVLSWQHEHHEWSQAETLKGFDPSLQSCIDDARDFFLPKSDAGPAWMPSF